MHRSTDATLQRLSWIGLLTVATVLASGVFACAVPFAALAAIAAFDFERTDGLLLIGAVWLANQIVGFAFLGYPLEAQALAWGIAIGLGAYAAYFAARTVARTLSAQSTLGAATAALAAGFLAYELVLFAATFVLPSGEGAFSYAVVSYIGLVNAVAFVVLLIAHRVAVAGGLLAPNAIETAA